MYLQPAVKQLPSQYNETTNHNQHSPQKVRITNTYNHHHHKTIQRLVNKHWNRFRTKQNGNPELPRNITMCYRRNPSLRNKRAKTRYIPELATPTNGPTLKPHCTNKCWNRKCRTCPNIPTRHKFLSTTLGTTHTTKCNYPCRSNGIVYLVTCKDATNSISAKH